MRKVRIDKIKGSEMLARPIYTSMHTVLLSEGVQMKESYKNKLIELGVEYIYVEDELSKGIEYYDCIKEEIREKSKLEIKKTMEKYCSQNKLILNELINVINEIIEEVLNQKEVLINIADIRKKDEKLYAHSVSVCTLSVLIAIKLGYNKKRIKDIAIGALLHDIGKILIPKEILNKQEPNERDIDEIRKHVIYGYEAVKNEISLNPVTKSIILTHHEKVDGSGYPFGWKREKIHDVSKLVAICNEFDNLSNNIYNKKQLKTYEIVEYLLSKSNIYFDTDILNVFIKNIALYPNGVGVVTNKKQKGIVLKQNKSLPSRPIIRLLEDENNKKIEEWKEIDLTEELTLFIVDTMEI